MAPADGIHTITKEQDHNALIITYSDDRDRLVS